VNREDCWRRILKGRMDFELRAAKAKWEKEQKEKKERARKRLELERKAKDEAERRQEAITAAQRIRRLEESAAALAVCCPTSN
jgi:hypothetical protein